MITIEQYLMGRDKLYPDQFNDQIKDNAIKIVDKVNILLFRLSIRKAEVSSGWRPPTVNKITPNSAKVSKHMIACAVYLKDPD